MAHNASLALLAYRAGTRATGAARVFATGGDRHALDHADYVLAEVLHATMVATSPAFGNEHDGVTKEATLERLWRNLIDPTHSFL